MLEAWPSNTDAHVVPLSFERHTPPPAVPTHSVFRSPGTPSMQAMRPLITPGPSARARRPSNVSGSSFHVSPLAAAAGFSAAVPAGFPAGACAVAPETCTASETVASRTKRAHARAERTAGIGSISRVTRWNEARRGPCTSKDRCACRAAACEELLALLLARRLCGLRILLRGVGRGCSRRGAFLRRRLGRIGDGRSGCAAARGTRGHREARILERDVQLDFGERQLLLLRHLLGAALHRER